MLRNLTAALVVLAVAGFASAAVTLDIQADQVAKTWAVYATASADTDGIAAYEINVTADGGVAIASSLTKGPRPYDGVLDDFIGFSLLRSNGTLGAGIAAAQNTVAGDLAYLLLGAAGGVESPILIAQGTYTGDLGNLYADVASGINEFPANYTGGAVLGAQVTGDMEAIPEPATMSLLGLGGLALIRRRR